MLNTGKSHHLKKTKKNQMHLMKKAKKKFDKRFLSDNFKLGVKINKRRN